MRALNLLPALALLLLPNCGASLGPECAAFARCCDAQNDSNCRRSAEESDKREGGEQACAAARSVFVQTMMCEDEEVEGGPDTMGVKSCDELATCCGQLGAETGLCLATARQLEAGPSAAMDCRTAFSAYLNDNRCRVAGATGPEDDNATCSDGIDNDNNGFKDCDDFECVGNASVCQMTENTRALCTDGVDNDGSGRMDCNDSSCDAVPNLCIPEQTNAACSDGFDNDADGNVDCADRDCQQTPEVTICGGGGTEDSNAACGDNIDNDSDGFTDCDDFDCTRNPNVTVCGGTGDPEDTNALCMDNLDNDGDGFFDCDDFDCSMNPNVTICP